MINTGDFKAIYTTVADQTTWYPVTFQYDSPNNTPELWVTIDGEGQTYGTDYIVGVGGVQLTYEPDAGLELIIRRSVPLTQEIDFQIGIIDPEQIEHGFDRSVMRDQEIADYAIEINDRVEEIENTISSYGDVVTHNVSEFATAAQGAKADTAVQPGDNVSVLTNDANYVVASDLATVATSGSYNDLTDKPTIGNGTITITQGGVTKGSFSVNQAGTTTIDVDAGGGGAVDSVNSKTGVVVLDASDVGALPSSTKYGASLSLSINSTTYVITATLKDQDGNTLGSAQTIDLPLESVVVSGAYDSATKEVVLTLQGGSTIRFSVADLVSGLQTEITSLNMLDADLVDDSTSTNKFVTASEKSAISTAVQPGDLAAVATSGNYSDLSGTPSLATVATSGLYSDLSGTPSLATVATSGDYGDLLNKPTIPDTTHMVTDNTAQDISAVKTFTAANPDATTAQTIVANYAVKFGTSGNNDLFAISANTNTSTLSIVGDNAANIIDIAASGAVLNHLQITQSDVTFGGTSLKNPGNMVGADGVNAGAAGLVPAPAATDNVNFLCGDGTWKAAGGGLPSQTGQDGKFLTTDGTDASWSDEPLLNDSTSSTGLAIGTTSDADFSVVIGESASSIPFASNVVAIGCSAVASGSSVAIGKSAQSSAGSVVVGYNSTSTGTNTIIIGPNARATANGAIQINSSSSTVTNSDANTFKVANANGNFEIMSADGTIPEERLADTTSAQQGDVLTLDANGDAVWQAAGGGSAPIAEVHTGSAVAPTAEGTNSLAVGNNAQAVQNFGSGDSATAIGNNSYSSPRGVAVGTGAYSDSSGVAVGASATADLQGVAIGNAVTSGNGGIIIGGYGVSTTGTDHAFDIVLNHYDAIMGINRHEKYTICDIDGHFPTDRFTTTPVSDGTYVPTLSISSGVATRSWTTPASAPVVPSITPVLLAASWSSNTQTITVQGVTSSNVVFVSPAPSSAQDYADAGVICTAQGTNSLTFTCDTVPSNDIDLSIVIL